MNAAKPFPLDQNTQHALADCVAVVVNICHGAACRAGWWNDLNTGEWLGGGPAGAPSKRNVGELLCLVHSEISEAMEGHRTSAMDKHLPHRASIEVELADALIRICDISAGLRLDLPGAVAEKLAFNAQRADHKREARLAADGKKY